MFSSTTILTLSIIRFNIFEPKPTAFIYLGIIFTIAISRILYTTRNKSANIVQYSLSPEFLIMFSKINYTYKAVCYWETPLLEDHVPYGRPPFSQKIHEF